MKKYGIQLPEKTLPIYIIGAGGIMRDAHLPAYQLAGFAVSGIYDLHAEKAKQVAEKFHIPRVFAGLEELVKEAVQHPCVYDLAVPGDAVLGVLRQLPAGSNVLIQKPMGNDLAEARAIRALCREKKLNAGINFQLRYAPYINEARQMIQEDLLGELCDIEVNVNVYTPWHLWDFLFQLPRVEILYHGIHYVDLIRTFFGNPERVYAKTVKHPAMRELASVRTTIIMDYGNLLRANILTNHAHNFGLHSQHAYIKFEGTRGAIKLRLGLLLNYPRGEPDHFEYVLLEGGQAPAWQTKTIEGSWFPHAFIGSMAQLMRAAGGEIAAPDNSVEDCIDTMACVEAAYVSSERGGVGLEEV